MRRRRPSWLPATSGYRPLASGPSAERFWLFSHGHLAGTLEDTRRCMEAPVAHAVSPSPRLERPPVSLQEAVQPTHGLCPWKSYPHHQTLSFPLTHLCDGRHTSGNRHDGTGIRPRQVTVPPLDRGHMNIEAEVGAQGSETWPASRWPCGADPIVLAVIADILPAVVPTGTTKNTNVSFRIEPALAAVGARFGCCPAAGRSSKGRPR
jgi:hypothetical protein